MTSKLRRLALRPGMPMTSGAVGFPEISAAISPELSRKRVLAGTCACSMAMGSGSLMVVGDGVSGDAGTVDVDASGRSERSSRPMPSSCTTRSRSRLATSPLYTTRPPRSRLAVCTSFSPKVMFCSTSRIDSPVLLRSESTWNSSSTIFGASPADGEARLLTPGHGSGGLVAPLRKHGEARVDAVEHRGVALPVAAAQLVGTDAEVLLPG